MPELLNKWYTWNDSAFSAETRTICPILTTVLQCILLPFFPFGWIDFSVLLCLVEQLQQDTWTPSHPKRSSSLRIKSCHANEWCKHKAIYLDRARYWSLSELHQFVHLTWSTVNRFNLPVGSFWSYTGSHCQIKSWGNEGCLNSCRCGMELQWELRNRFHTCGTVSSAHTDGIPRLWLSWLFVSEQCKVVWRQ